MEKILVTILAVFLVYFLIIRSKQNKAKNRKNGNTTTKPSSTSNRSDKQPPSLISNSGLEIIDSKIGDGQEAISGNIVTVHYRGTLDHGIAFDSSYGRGQPFTFKLGAGEVIQGWDEGVAGMKVGGKRKLVIPPELGYGSRAAGNVIPPNATLIFDIELLDVKE
jgi:FKBP-type peptidyl-prolyl cis-trans isomerase